MPPLALLAFGCAAPSPWTALPLEMQQGAFVPTRFGGEGEVSRSEGTLVFDFGSPLTGITWTGPFPTVDYELRLQAARLAGDDFFCGLTFPVGERHLTLVLGGWGGSLVGLSSLEGRDAAHNETRRFVRFERGRFYRVRVRVTAEKVQAWLDDEPIVDLDWRGRELSLRPEVLLCRPMGICSYATRAAVRDLRLRRL